MMKKIIFKKLSIEERTEIKAGNSGNVACYGESSAICRAIDRYTGGSKYCWKTANDADCE